MNVAERNHRFMQAMTRLRKFYYTVSLWQWDAMTPEERGNLQRWCADNNYEVHINLDDLGPDNRYQFKKSNLPDEQIKPEDPSYGW